MDRPCAELTERALPRVAARIIADIDDELTVSLIRSFHRYATGGMAPAEALRAAQMDAIRRGGGAAVPKNWASFVVYTANP